ncbi:MAG: 2-oxo acid dehydrogenase subunit E2 [Acidimicrobiia bacterium]|nr:2-oxo acid dehydrogenase subunit E2 [Acidimicrobiia bacterium]
MSIDVLMPVITAAGDEAVVTAWFVDEGQPCTEGLLIAEVQAEKVADEVNALSQGYIVNRVAIGDPVAQGNPICQIVESIEQPTPAAAPATEAPPQTVVASPAAKRLARESGVDLSGISGSGPEGRITEEDVRSAAQPARPAMGGLRAVIARNMRRSHVETAPVTLFSTVSLGELPPSNLTATIVKVVAETLADHPHLNGHRDGDLFIPAGTAQVAVAIQTEEGLVAPVVRDAAARPVEEVARAIRELAERAGSKTLTPADYDEATFTVSNLGGYGIDGFTPIINLPQVAILGVGAARPTPVFDRDGHVAIGYQMVLSLTFDHAFVDGAPAAAFLQQVAAALAG